MLVLLLLLLWLCAVSLDGLLDGLSAQSTALLLHGLVRPRHHDGFLSCSPMHCMLHSLPL
jgi:hypothetical protein